MLNDFYETVHAMNVILENCQCGKCPETSNSVTLVNQFSNLMFIVDQPILGPNRVSIDDCLSFTHGTAKRSRDLIIFVKRPEIQLLLYKLIDDLEAQAERCCLKGRVWKACLQPLVNKWHLWNEKYKLLGIPPDPAWD